MVAPTSIRLFGFDAPLGVFAGFGAHDKVDNNGGDDKDDDEEEPDWAFDDHFGNLLSYAFEFYRINYIEDAESGGVVPDGFVIKRPVWKDGHRLGFFFVRINFFVGK